MGYRDEAYARRTESQRAYADELKVTRETRSGGYSIRESDKERELKREHSLTKTAKRRIRRDRAMRQRLTDESYVRERQAVATNRSRDWTSATLRENAKLKHRIAELEAQLKNN